MEVLVDTVEVEASVAVDDDGTATLWMEKKRRRVSFAHTDTVHVIPRDDDLQTPPLVLNTDPLSGAHNTPIASDLSIAGTPASQPTAVPHIPVLHSHENSADFSQFTCDMDTCHGSSANEDFTTSTSSFDGMEDDSGCFVHLGHISRVEDDDSIVNDVMDYEMTMDATTFSKNLSYYLKSSTTSDLQETGLLGQVLSNKSSHDSDSRSLDDSMALTRPGAPHWALVNPDVIFIHADGNEHTDMSLTTGHGGQGAPNKRTNNSFTKSENDSLAFSKQEALHCAPVCPQDVSVCGDDDQNDLSLTKRTLFQTTVPKHAVEALRDSNKNVSVVAVDQPSNQFKGLNRNAFDKKPALMEVKKPNEGQQLIGESLRPIVVEPRSLSKVQQPYKARGRPVLADSTNLQHLPEDNLQEGKKLPKASPQKTRMDISSEVSAGVSYSGGAGKESHTKGLRCLEDILRSLKGKNINEDQGEDENMTLLLPTRLQTLGDYLQFSCSVQPQMDWLREHVQELEAKLEAAKKRNAELKSSNGFAQLPEESTHIFRSKFANKHSLAKKGWLLWKMKPERQILSWLQERKDNLLKEVEGVHIRHLEVMHLKESYSQVVLNKSLYSGQTATIFAASSKKDQLSTHRQSREMDSALEKYHHHYQDAFERLRISKAKWNKIENQIQSIASAYSHKVQSANDSSMVLFEKHLEALIQRLLFTNNVVQQQQVMESNLKLNGGKSVVDFSLEGMYSWSFRFEGDGPRVKLLTTLHPEAIEMTFPCMNAFLPFQYIINDPHSVASVQMQQVHGIIRRTNYLFGSLMDVLKEMRYCRRNFWISCKFKMQDDKLLLHVTFLRSVSGLKVTLTFDMLLLKQGMYPCDLKPVDIEIETYGCTSTESITRREAMARIAKIQPGFARLHRICSCVEELMRTVKENA